MENQIIQSLNDSGIKFVRVLWCDNANVIRGKAVHIGALAEFLEHGVGLAASEQSLPVMYDTLVPDSGLGPTGEIRLIPNWSTLATLPYAPGHARVLGDMVLDGEPWALCPRWFLRRAIADAERESVEIMAAFENEFYLLQPDFDKIIPGDNTVFASTLAMDINCRLINEICEALVIQNIPVEQYYPESGTGQHEISIRFTVAQQASDRQIAFRETVHAIARQFGLRASFLPKVFADQAGSGCHLHLSLWHKEQNLVPDPNDSLGLSAIARAFIAGILDHLPALMSLTTPTPNSYRRIRPHSWSGAFSCWGQDNREAAVRVPKDPAVGAANFELRTCDASANPYLALGGVIVAGMDGIRRGLKLGEPLSSDPGYLSEAEQSARGITRLPVNLSEALDNLKRDELLLDALGSELVKSYLAVRTAELEALSKMELEDEVKLLLERY